MSDTRNRDPAPPPDSRVTDQSLPKTDTGAFAFKSSGDDDSIPGLLKQLMEQGSHLAAQQLKLVETEIRSGIDDLKTLAGAMAGAAVLGLAGLGVLLMGVAYLLAEAMPLWLATMIVAAVALGGAYAMFAAAQKKLQASSLNVDRTKRTLERAPTAMSGHSKKGSRNDR